jgi:hypothetical protein
LAGVVICDERDRTMRDLLIRVTKFARRSAPATIAVAAAAFSLGAYSGHAAALTAQRSARHSFTLTLSSKSLTLQTGSSKRLSIAIHRHRLRARVALKVISKLPRGLTVRFVPSRTRRRRTTLVLRASSSTLPRHYKLRIRATGGHVRRTVTLSLNLVMRRTAVQSRTGANPDFSLTGDVGTPLEPGMAEPIDVRITNPNSLPLTVNSLTVTLQSVSAPQATPALPCTQADFTTQPYSGQLPVTVPAGGSETLSELGIPSDQWPEISLADLPTNQDGCQGASLSLAYSADARLG